MRTRCNLTDHQIECRLSTLEKMMLETDDAGKLKAINSGYQRLLDEQVQREFDKEERERVMDDLCGEPVFTKRQRKRSR